MKEYFIYLILNFKLFLEIILVILIIRIIFLPSILIKKYELRKIKNYKLKAINDFEKKFNSSFLFIIFLCLIIMLIPNKKILENIFNKENCIKTHLYLKGQKNESKKN